MYWAEIFHKYNYVCFDIVRKEIWDNEQIAWWYRQNTFFYVNKDKADIFKTLNYKPTQKPMYLVNPDMYENKNKQCEYLSKEIEKLQNKLNKTFLRRLNRISKRLRGKL